MTRTMNAGALFVSVAVVSSVLSLTAAEPSTSAVQQSPENYLTNYNFDHAPNAVPAFEALGLSPESVTSPTTPREFATDLLNGVDQQGVLQHGLAIEVAPFRVVGPKTTLQRYQQSQTTRWLYDFSISIATSKATDKSDAVQLAIGFKEVLYESADHSPYRNPQIEAAAENIREEVHHWKPDYNAPPPSISEANLQAYKNAVDDFAKNKWQGAIWTAAIAPTWNSESGKIGDLSTTGFTTWTAFAYGLHQDKTHPLRLGLNDPINIQFIGEMRYRDGEEVTDPNDKTRRATQNTFLAAARLRLGSDTFNGFAEGGYVRVWHGLNGDGDGTRGAVGVEKRLTENIWLVLSAGEQFGEAGAKTNNLFVISSLRFGTADKAQFAQ